jgi:subtilisin family serine protease
MHPGATPYWKRAGIRLIPLLVAVAAIGLSLTDRTSAAPRVAKPAPAANAPKPQNGKDAGRTVARPPSAPPANAASQREEKNGRQQAAQGGAKTNTIARNGLPRRPLPGEAGFTGVPPRGERRFISNEMVFHSGANVSPQAVEAAARRLGLTPLGAQSLTLTGGRLFRFRLGEGRQVADAVRALEAEKLGTAQPNYVYSLQQNAASAPTLPAGDAAQYAVIKLRLRDVHRWSVGKDVPVAVIDSQIDAAHPDLAGAFGEQFDAVGKTDKADNHGTGMTGAIVAHRRLLGVAPGARILAVHAFSPDQQNSAQATTQHVLAGIDWAIEKGARIINMSFAGPYDPMLQLALKKAHDKGIVLIAAAGNAGPRSQPLYPAADENVIAVTAIDADDRLLPQANQGRHIALAAPGVGVLEPAANAGYQLTTGTSVAAAHVSGVAALIIARKPDIDFAALEKILFSTAKGPGSEGTRQPIRIWSGRSLSGTRRPRGQSRGGSSNCRGGDVGGHGGIRNIPGQPTCSWRRTDTRASQHAARGRRRARQLGEKTPRLPAGGREQRNARSRPAGLRRYLRGGSSLGLPEAGSRAKSPWSGTQRLPQQLPGIVARFLPAFTALERHPPTSTIAEADLLARCPL